MCPQLVRLAGVRRQIIERPFSIRFCAPTSNRLRARSESPQNLRGRQRIRLHTLRRALLLRKLLNLQLIANLLNMRTHLQSLRTQRLLGGGSIGGNRRHGTVSLRHLTVLKHHLEGAARLHGLGKKQHARGWAIQAVNRNQQRVLLAHPQLGQRGLRNIGTARGGRQKMRVREQNPLLIPIHRLDRPTAGVLLFAKTVEARRPFQMMFQHRQVSKTYRAVAPVPADATAAEQALSEEGLQVRSHIQKIRDQLQVQQLSEEQCAAQGVEPNTLTTVKILRTFTPSAQAVEGWRAEPTLNEKREWTLYDLAPHTGKTHQLRAHLNLLGSPILGDVLYQQLQRVLGTVWGVG